MKNLYVFFLTLSFVLGSYSITFACLDLPANPPPTEITCIDADHIKVRLKGYTTYGASTSDYCACALNVPATFGNVISATIVETCTDNAINGWSFTPNPNTQFSAPADWQGLSSAVSTAIASGILVDVCFVVALGDKRESGIDCSDLANDLASFFESEDVVVGTAGADANGKPDHHISQTGISEVSVLGDDEISLYGTNYQGLNTAALDFVKAEICVNIQNQAGNDGVRIDYGKIEYGIIRFGKPEVGGTNASKSISAFGDLGGIPSSFLGRVNTFYDGTNSAVSVEYASATDGNIFLEIRANCKSVTKVQVDEMNKVNIKEGSIEIAEIDPIWDMPSGTMTIIKLPEAVTMELPNGDTVTGNEIIYSTKFEKPISYISHIDVTAKDYKKVVLKLGDMDYCE